MGKYTEDDFEKFLGLEQTAADGTLKTVDDTGFKAILNSSSLLTARTEDKKTLLHVAAKYQCVTKIDILIDQGADVNAQDIFGRTPLHTLIQYGVNNRIPEDELIKIVIPLVKAGSDPEKKAKMTFFSRNQVVDIFELINKSNLSPDFKNQIILARLIFLTEQALEKYQKDRTSCLRKGPAEQRTIGIQNIKTALYDIQNSQDTPITKINNIKTLLETQAGFAAADHKQHGSLMLFGHGPTRSGFARKLNDIANHPIMKKIPQAFTFIPQAAS